MAARYWVGGTGNWADNTNHWATVDGGSPGASLPTSSDDVYITANSFSINGQYIIVSSSAICRSMDWSALGRPAYLLLSSGSLDVYGDFILDSYMTNVAGSAPVRFVGTGGERIVNTAGKTIIPSVYFSGSGSWTLQSTFTTIGDVYIYNGALITDNHAVNCRDFRVESAYFKELMLGSSIITCSGNILFTGSDIVKHTDTATFKMTGNVKTFNGAGLTFYNLEITGTPATIAGSNTFNDLKVSAGNTVNFTAGITITLTSLTGDGVLGSLITIQSTLSGTPYTITMASGRIEKHYYSVQDCIFTGAAICRMVNSTDVSGNTGILFHPVYPCDITETDRTNIVTLLEAVQDYKSKLINKIAEVQANDKVSTFIADIFNPTIADLQSQVDGQISTWFYGYTPTLLLPPVDGNPDPADDWSTNEIKDTHLGDLFYDTTTGYGYRFAYESGTYQWISVDTDVAAALAAAQAAQDTADGKRRVFVVTPTPPYDVGDLWSSGIAGDIMKCKTAKASGGSYAAEDWEPATVVGSWIYGSTYEATAKFDGKNIQAETVTANHMKAGELEVGGKVGAGYLGTYIGPDGIYTGTVEANKINVGTLIGFLIQTAASGKRVIVNATDNSIDIYDPNDALCGQLDWDNNGVAPDAVQRIFLRTLNNTALKIYSGNDMSIESAGTTYIAGDVDFSNATVTGLHAQWG